MGPPCRPFQYDPDTNEYFVQTADTVKVKRCELEKWLSAEEKEQKDGVKKKKSFHWFSQLSQTFRLTGLT